MIGGGKIVVGFLKRALLGTVLVLSVLAMMGCEWQTEYTLGEQMEFLPESGADQYVICQSLASR